MVLANTLCCPVLYISSSDGAVDIQGRGYGSSLIPDMGQAGGVLDWEDVLKHTRLWEGEMCATLVDLCL